MILLTCALMHLRQSQRTKPFIAISQYVQLKGLHFWVTECFFSCSPYPHLIFTEDLDAIIWWWSRRSFDCYLYRKKILNLNCSFTPNCRDLIGSRNLPYLMLLPYLVMVTLGVLYTNCCYNYYIVPFSVSFKLYMRSEQKVG